MKTTFTKATANFGCYSGQQVVASGLKEKFTIEQVLNTTVRLKDKAWFIRNNCELSGKELREFAIGCALCVLPIYETRNPDNNAPREAIEAAQAYLAGTIGIEELRQKRTAAGAAYAVYAAYAVAYAADAAAAADAAYAAYAVAYAADAAADAADAGNYQQSLLNFFKDFTNQMKTK